MPDSSDADVPDQPVAKPGKLTLKPRAQPVDQGDRPSKTVTNKTGARAHNQRRAQTEQKRVQAPNAAPARSASTTPRSPTRTATRPPNNPDRRVRDRHAGARSQSEHDKSGRVQSMRSQSVHHHERSATASRHYDTAPDASELFDMFASCPRGLEQALSEELIAIGLNDVRPAQAGCRLRGNWSDVWRANLHSRLATRILVQLAHAKVANEDELRQLALGVNWERWLGPEKTLRVDTSAIRSPMQSLQYCNLLVKDSVCDRLRDKEGARPSVDTVRPDVRVHSFLSQDSATLYLDTSGESLFKRGWRFDKAEAPIRENLAAGLLAVSGWDPHTPLLDPFCGSGTILIEAAWKALNIAPGINRPFAFERLRAHDAHAWQAMRQAATALIATDLPAPIVGCDLSERAIEAARANTKRAGLRSDIIDWRVQDARQLDSPSPTGMIVTNPPYGERLEIESDLMSSWAAQLKQHFSGWQVNVISADHSLPGAMRLKPKRRVPLFNGALDCRLFMFDMVKEHYDPKKH